MNFSARLFCSLASYLKVLACSIVELAPVNGMDPGL
jgi:hypothetical protein